MEVWKTPLQDIGKAEGTPLFKERKNRGLKVEKERVIYRGSTKNSKLQITPGKSTSLYTGTLS